MNDTLLSIGEVYGCNQPEAECDTGANACHGLHENDPCPTPEYRAIQYQYPEIGQRDWGNEYCTVEPLTKKVCYKRCKCNCAFEDGRLACTLDAYDGAECTGALSSIECGGDDCWDALSRPRAGPRGFQDNES